MTKLALRVALTAFFFVYVLPLVPGAHFTGTFWPAGIGYGFLLAGLTWLFSLALGIFAIGTLGLGLILMIFFFWLIPAVQLEMLAYFFPQNLAFDGFGSAVLAGLVLMGINMLTGGMRATISFKRSKKD